MINKMTTEQLAAKVAEITMRENESAAAFIPPTARSINAATGEIIPPWRDPAIPVNERPAAPPAAIASADIRKGYNLSMRADIHKAGRLWAVAHNLTFSRLLELLLKEHLNKNTAK